MVQAANPIAGWSNELPLHNFKSVRTDCPKETKGLEPTTLNYVNRNRM